MYNDTLTRLFSAFWASAQRYLSVLATMCLVACSAADDDNRVMDRQGSLMTAVYRVNCGAGAVGSFSADQYVSGGNTWSSGSVSTTGVANAAPAAVYASERYGNYAYTFGSLQAGASYVVRLHFAETKFNTSGARQFNVDINGAQALSNFDIFTNAGFSKALVLDFNAVASASGQIVVRYTSVVDNAKSSAIEILSNDSGSPGNQSPTIATPAAASANPVTATSTALSVLGADDAGESALVYTWATSGTPPAAVSFSVNGSNAAKNTVATFGKAG